MKPAFSSAVSREFGPTSSSNAPGSTTLRSSAVTSVQSATGSSRSTTTEAPAGTDSIATHPIDNRDRFDLRFPLRAVRPWLFRLDTHRVIVDARAEHGEPCVPVDSVARDIDIDDVNFVDAEVFPLDFVGREVGCGAHAQHDDGEGDPSPFEPAEDFLEEQIFHRADQECVEHDEERNPAERDHGYAFERVDMLAEGIGDAIFGASGVHAS